MVIYVSNDFKPKHVNDLENLRLLNLSDYDQRFYSMYFNRDRDLLYFQGVTEVYGDGDIFLKGSKINKFYSKILKLLTPNTKKIIIDNSSEAPSIDYIKKVNIFFNSKGLDSCYIQSGFDNLDINDRVLYHPSFLKDHITPFIPLKDRTHAFNSLNRLVWGREHRLLVTYLLYKNNLLDHGVVSCGSGDSEEFLGFVFKKIKRSINEIKDLSDFVNTLPLKVDKKVDVISTNTSTNQNNPGFDSIINLVTESSFERFRSKLIGGLEYTIGWERLFFTEKTAKFVNCNQIPLFIAPYGYVDRLRSFGFDVFDDMVNHSYDLQEDPDLRIKMVVKELVRLVDNIENIINSEDMELRFKKNRMVLKRLHTRRLRKYQVQLKNFVTVDRPIDKDQYQSLILEKYCNSLI